MSPVPLTASNNHRLSNTGPIQARSLKKYLTIHPFFANRNLADVMEYAELIHAEPGECVVEFDDLNPHIHFLAAGELALQDRDGRVRHVKAGDADAHFPVARLRPSSYEVTATTRVSLIAVEQSVLRRMNADARRAHFVQTGAAVAGSWQAHPLAIEVLKASSAGTLALPVIPAIALKVRRALSREDYAIGQVADLIATDPVISTKLLKVANSALFPGAATCQSVQAGVVRLGVKKVQSVVLALSSAALFNEQAPSIRAQFAALWRHLIEIAGLCASLAKLNGEVDDGSALLTGLLHEIGKIPVLQRAQSYPDLLEQPGLLADITNGLGPLVSTNTLRQWGLPDPIVDAVTQQGNWTYDHDGPCDITDILLVSHVLSLAKAGAREQLPRLDETPAFEKITKQRLSPKLSLQVLQEVEQRAAELKSLLR